KEFGPLLQWLVFRLAKILLQNHDLVAVKMYRSEPGAAALRVLKAITPAKHVGHAEIDDRRHSVDLDTASKTAITRQNVTKIAATVTPLVINKRKPFFPVTKTHRTGKRIHDIHGEDSTTFFWLSRALLIRRTRSLCAHQPLGSDSDQ